MNNRGERKRLPASSQARNICLKSSQHETPDSSEKWAGFLFFFPVIYNNIGGKIWLFLTSEIRKLGVTRCMATKGTWWPWRRGSERTVGLPGIHLQCLQVRGAISINPPSLCFPGPSCRLRGNPLHTTEQKSHCPAPLLSGHLLSEPGVPSAQPGDSADLGTPLLFRHAASMLGSRAATFLERSGPDVRHGEDAGRRVYVGVINVRRLENTNKIKINELTSTSSPNEAVSD